jgi:hypothetical protein
LFAWKLHYISSSTWSQVSKLFGHGEDLSLKVSDGNPVSPQGIRIDLDSVTAHQGRLDGVAVLEKSTV